ncbi:hypothetical protein [Stella sp.]|uniref:hypothetical protein n=1 Tax=Stella sp. TaxID=2912054 RepID=UPI0035B33E61
MTPSILRKVAAARAPQDRRPSDVGMVLAICIGIVFVPVIGLCAAAMSEATPISHRSAAAPTQVAERTP